MALQLAFLDRLLLDLRLHFQIRRSLAAIPSRRQGAARLSCLVGLLAPRSVGFDSVFGAVVRVFDSDAV
ncbi:hypothetical protein ABWH93_14250 [Seohaeicola saemankumensis]|uniref:hypothetical protein n=1 Tax=Seohaeicola TaxID=481178 RepID=UPI0035D0F034